MRFIGTIQDERRAYLFYCALAQMGIESSYEEGKGTLGYAIWVYDEDRIDEALKLLERYEKSPDDPVFTKAKEPPPPPPADPLREEERREMPPEFKVKVRVRARRPVAHPLNNFLILVCVLLYFFNSFQENKLIREKGKMAAQIVLSPLQKVLMFDDPAAMRFLNELVEKYNLKDVKDVKDFPRGARKLLVEAEQTPSWKGLLPTLLKFPKGGWAQVAKTPLFEKISQGQVWRLITPIFMHRDFLHILFNMAWLWILGAQIEERIARWKMLLLILIVGIVSNVAQYLVSGPFFMGFSGVVVGMVGFIWMRQKRAPWEGYPLNRPTVIFILLFVLAMFVLEIVAVVLQLVGVTDSSMQIANTAHIVGGLCGLALGHLSFFGRKSGREA